MAWAAQDAELEAEIAALEAAGALAVPAEEEQSSQALSPEGASLDGLYEWLADLADRQPDDCVAAPAEFTGTRLPRTSFPDDVMSGRAGFAAGGAADLSQPGAALAAWAEDARAAGLSKLTDDELTGVIRAGRRLSSWASSLELAAVNDLMRRREQQEAAGHRHAAEHADAEIAALLTLTGRGAGRVLDMAIALRRLPLTARALEAGAIDLPRVAVIADETTSLDDDQASAVEQHILVRAPGQTTSQLRAAARRSVIATDPRAAKKRQEQAQREARVERWDEHAGTAALAGRDLPPAAVIAADQHISALARDLRAAGLTGTADQLRAQAFLALLSGVSAVSLLPAGHDQQDPPGNHCGFPAEPGTPRNLEEPANPGTPRDLGSPGVPGMPGCPVTFGQAGCPAGPATASAPGPSTDALSAANATVTAASACTTADRPGIPAVAGMVNLTVPLSTWLGLLDSPGEVAGFGPLAADDSRHLGVAMTAHPHTRWCVTLTGADGRPSAHGCARPAHGPPPPAYGLTPPTPGQPPSAHAAALQTHGPPPPEECPAATSWAGVAAWLADVPMKWFESAECAHSRQSAAYRPPPALRHLIGARQQVCAFPGCRRSANQCDLDHTTPFHRGGLTCECNLAPLCRKHHEAKQAPGWHVEHPRPGVLTWTTPDGRSYTTEPTVYPV